MDKSNSQQPEKKRSLGVLLQLFKYIFKYKFMFLTVIIVVIASNLLMLAIPYITGIMVDALGLGSGNIDYYALARNAGYIVLIALAVWCLSAVQNLLMLKTAQNVVVDLRRDVFNALTHLPVSFFDTNTKGNIIAIIAADVDNISDTVSSDLITLITGAVTVIGSITMMLTLSWHMTLIFVFTVPLMFVIARFISRNARRLFRTKKNWFGRLCGYAEEMITAQKTVKVYGIEDYNEENFDELSAELQKSGAKAEFVSSTMMPSMNCINNINFTLICAIGAMLAVGGHISIGNISTFALYAKRFAAPIVDTASIINMLQATLAACDRVFTVLNSPQEPMLGTIDGVPLLPEQAVVREANDITGAIELSDVSFEYKEGAPVLNDISFNVRPGERIAVVGATGSGKTTIISLLMRFYELARGSILLDGVDIRSIPLKKLRSYFALILQDSWLFEGTVAENIAYAAPEGRNDRDTIVKMCQDIHVDEFISTLPNGYDTVLRNDSGGLSQGQRQLINIARTFLCDPPIFILDEATSSIDTLTEYHIQRVTEAVTSGKTSIIIAHRLTTIRNADRIISMQNGRIVEIGTHDELIARGGQYATMYYSQFEQA